MLEWESEVTGCGVAPPCGQERPGDALGHMARGRAVWLGCRAKEVELRLCCWGVVRGFKQQNDIVRFENYPGISRSTSQHFSKMSSAGVSLLFPREGK